MTPTDPAVAAPKKLMTADEFWEFVNRPENENRLFELIRGEVVEMSRPTHPHGRVAMRIGSLLERYGEVTGRGYPVGNDSGVVLEEDPDTVVGPDVGFFPGGPDFGDLAPKWAEIPPLLAVEVLSPNDKPSKVIAKIRDYLDNGVLVVWLVDYEERTVSVFRPDSGPVVLREADELSGGKDLPGFACRVADLFRVPGSRPPEPTPPPAPPTT